MAEPGKRAPDPHGGQPTVRVGAAVGRAEGVVILLHGRGAGPEGILGLADELDRPEFAWLAPRASGDTWYPHGFLAPLERNEPHLGSALGLVDSVVEEVLGQGVPSERLLLLGFSQGACLALEYAARHPRRYGGVVGLTGGLVGPEGTPRDYPGSLDGTPVFLGTSDPDPHVPRERVEETARVLEGMGAEVTLRIYPHMGHTVNRDELERVREMLEKAANGPVS